MTAQLRGRGNPQRASATRRAVAREARAHGGQSTGREGDKIAVVPLPAHGRKGRRPSCSSNQGTGASRSRRPRRGRGRAANLGRVPRARARALGRVKERGREGAGERADTGWYAAVVLQAEPAAAASARGGRARWRRPADGGRVGRGALSPAFARSETGRACASGDPLWKEVKGRRGVRSKAAGRGPGFSKSNLRPRRAARLKTDHRNP